MKVEQNRARRSWEVKKAMAISIFSREEPRITPQARERIAKWLRFSPDRLRNSLEADHFVRYIRQYRLLDRDREPQPAAPPPARRRDFDLVPRRSVLLISSAAAVALAVGTSLFALRDDEPSIRHVTLADGSVAHVLRGSDFSVDLSDSARLIHLHGEAVFEVAKDPNRPFVVRTRASDSIAVGTRFGVRATSSETTTTVSEGTVGIVRAGSDWNSGTLLHAGQELRVPVGASEPVSVVAVDAERRMSWAAGWLSFSDEPAGNAVSEFNRYSDVRIEITQADLANARLKYGRFEIDKPESFAAAVGTAVNARVTRNPKRNVIYIGGTPE